MSQIAPLDYARDQCSFCRNYGPPEHKSGQDPSGGYVSGWTHEAKGGRVRCAAYQIWETARQEPEK